MQRANEAPPSSSIGKLSPLASAAKPATSRPKDNNNNNNNMENKFHFGAAKKKKKKKEKGVRTASYLVEYFGDPHWRNYKIRPCGLRQRK
jgi:hypothetical protein